MKVILFLSLLFLISAGFAGDNDPFFPLQWSLHNDGTQSISIEFDKYHRINQYGKSGIDIGWLEAKEQIVTLGKNPVLVGILDSGLDMDPNRFHPELEGRVDSHAKDLLANAPVLLDADGHGTQVAGLIAANFDNGNGIAGITPNAVKILPLRVFADKTFEFFKFRERFTSDYAADGIRYAMKNGASIINMSLTWARLGDTENMRKAVNEAKEAGVLLVADAGNESREHSTFPCAYDGVLCVGSITNTGEKASYSNYGGMVDVLAPGDNLISLYLLGHPNLVSQIFSTPGYESFKGTSGAAPEITGVAATLKSIFPSISVTELKARILASAQPPPPGIALYGLVNLKRAIDLKPLPVYLPHFKTVDDGMVDEKTLIVKSSVQVESLWAPGKNVLTQVLVNGKIAGQVRSSLLTAGEMVTVPWQYQFKSLDESAILKVVLHVTDASGTSKDFPLNLMTARTMSNLKLAKQIPLPTMKAENWIKNNNGSLGFNVEMDQSYEVHSYPVDTGPKSFYKVLTADQQSVTVQILDPTNPTANVVVVPGIQKINEVLRIDVKGDGTKDWVISGSAQTDAQSSLFQFYFLDQKFQPLWGNQAPAQWVVTNNETQKLERNYNTPGSWIRDGQRLLPCFLDQGFLPTSDGFNGLDLRHFVVANHFIYLNPTTRQSNIQRVEVRALDNASFRVKYPNIYLRGVISTSPGLGILVQMGEGTDAPIYKWQLNSLADSTLEPISNWSALSASGNISSVQSVESQNESVLAGPIDELGHSGSVSWATADGQLLTRTDYDYTSARNTVENFTGAFDLSNLGRYWFIETTFDIVGFRQGSQSPQHLPLERDSSYTPEYFRRNLKPVLAGTVTRPLPGVLYNDGNLVRKNEVFLTDWNPSTDQLERPLRYSLKIPDGCFIIDTFRPPARQELLAFSLLCQQNGSLSYKVLVP